LLNSITVAQQDLLFSLTLDHSIHIHNIESLENLHTLGLSVPDPRLLISAYTSPVYLAGIASSSAKELLPIKAALCRPDSGSKSRPTTPDQTRKHTAYLEDSDQLTQVPILLLSKNGLSAIRRPSALDHALHHLRLNRYQEALACFGPEDHTGRGLINFKIGMHHVRATEFEEAGVFLAVACDEGLDPRLLILAWPDLVERSQKVDSSLETEVWQGAADDVQELSQGMERIIMDSLYKNYSPHIKPEDESQALHAQLSAHSRAMIRLVLGSYREGRAQKASPAVRSAVYAALARLAAEADSMDDCLSLAASGLIDVEDLILWLQNNAYLDVLSRLYQQFNRTEDSLGLWVESAHVS
jgi:hypothetical protein